MRKYGRVDSNQADIVKSLRQAGCSVLILSDVGGGCPDLLVGRSGQDYKLECKDPTKPPSKRCLTPDERDFFREWKGSKPMVVETPGEALYLCGVINSQEYRKMCPLLTDKQRAAKTRSGRKGAATSRKAPGDAEKRIEATMRYAQEAKWHKIMEARGYLVAGYNYTLPIGSVVPDLQQLPYPFAIIAETTHEDAVLQWKLMGHKATGEWRYYYRVVAE